MLKRDIFISIVIFILFVIGLIMTIENIQEEQNHKKDVDLLGFIFNKS